MAGMSLLADVDGLGLEVEQLSVAFSFPHPVDFCGGTTVTSLNGDGTVVLGSSRCGRSDRRITVLLQQTPRSCETLCTM